MQMNWRKIMAGALLSATVMGSYTYGSTTYAAAASNAQVSVQQGEAKGNVNLRSKPSTSGKIVAKIHKGDRIQIIDKGSRWYEVKTSSGKRGFASSKYIALGGNTSSNQGSGSSSSGNSNGSATSSAGIEKAINTGMKYLGTPYEFGSNRNTTTTFDCSDFIRQVFLEGTGIKLPSDSRKQGAWIKDKGTDVGNISSLKRGDLVFFMSYKGSSASSYAGLDKSKQRITHVAIYLGDNKLLHTYSKKSGGVLVGDFGSSWKNRFLYGGSVL